MIGPDDLDRIVAELTHWLETIEAKNPNNPEAPIAAWMEKNQVSDEMSDRLIEMMTHLVSPDDGPIRVATGSDLRASLLMAFVLGWETGLQYGRAA